MLSMTEDSAFIQQLCWPPKCQALDRGAKLKAPALEKLTFSGETDKKQHRDFPEGQW